MQVQEDIPGKTLKRNEMKQLRSIGRVRFTCAGWPSKPKWLALTALILRRGTGHSFCNFAHSRTDVGNTGGRAETFTQKRYRSEKSTGLRLNPGYPNLEFLSQGPSRSLGRLSRLTSANNVSHRCNFVLFVC